MTETQKKEDRLTSRDLVLVTAVTVAASYAAVKVMAKIGDAVIDTFTLARKYPKTDKKA